MLSDLDDVQDSEEVWGTSNVSFTIQTRDTSGNELIERTYTFSHAPEWEKWTFNEFEERRTIDTTRITDRDWRRVKRRTWHKGEEPPVDIPPTVSDEVEELLDISELTVQL